MHGGSAAEGRRVTSRSRGRLTCRIGVLVACVALMAACGDGGSSGDASSASAPGMTKVSIGIASANLTHLPVWYAQSKGLYQREGLDVTVAVLSPATTNAALTSGSVQFLSGSTNNFLAAVQQNTGQLAVQNHLRGTPLGLVIGNRLAREKGITKDTPPRIVAEALVGSTGGSASKATTGEVAMFLRENGVNIDQMKLANLSSPQAYLTALRRNQINWFCTGEPVPLQAESEGAGIVVAHPSNVMAWSPDNVGPGGLIVTSRNYARNNPETVRKFVKATQEAIDAIRQDPTSDNVVGVAAEHLPGVPHDVLAQAIKTVVWNENGEMTSQDWQAAVRFITQLGVVPKDAQVTSQDWTNEYLPRH